jgi:pimeloyl-ACP methyl ester carboxylesterase
MLASVPVIPPEAPPFPPRPDATGWLRTDDGLDLWWQRHGPPFGDRRPLVCSNGVGVSVFFWRYVVDGFCGERPVLLWDYRGHGRSQDVSDEHEVSVERCAEDLLLLLEDRGIEDAVLLGHSMGVQVDFELYRRDPSRVAALVAVLGTAGRPLKTFAGMKDGQPVFDLILNLFRAAGPRTQEVLRRVGRWPGTDTLVRLVRAVHPRLAPASDLRRYREHLSSMDFPTFARMVEALGEHSAWDLLPRVQVPTLIIAGQRDTFSPLPLSEAMAEALPRSDMILLPDASHAGLVEQPLTINLALRRFLQRRVAGESPNHP